MKENTEKVNEKKRNKKKEGTEMGKKIRESIWKEKREKDKK